MENEAQDLNEEPTAQVADDGAATVDEELQPPEAAPDDEVVVTIGDEPAAADDDEQSERAPEWVRDLRKRMREKDRRIRELESMQKEPESKPQELGKKPTIDDFDYDSERFEVALADWLEKKRHHDAEIEKSKQAEQSQKQEWQDRLADYGKRKTELKVADFEDAEAATQDALTVVQQGIILQGADNPAVIVYALGRNPAKLAELSKITDPVKFSFAVAKLEKDLKVTTKKQAPPPERVIQGTGRVSGTVDSKLDQLREQAAKTGDYSKVAAYKLQKRGG